MLTDPHGAQDRHILQAYPQMVVGDEVQLLEVDFHHVFHLVVQHAVGAEADAAEEHAVVQHAYAVARLGRRQPAVAGGRALEVLRLIPEDRFELEAPAHRKAPFLARRLEEQPVVPVGLQRQLRAGGQALGHKFLGLGVVLGLLLGFAGFEVVVE